MPPTSRKRRAPTEDDEAPAPTPTQTQRRDRRQHETPADADESDGVDEEEQESGSGSVAQLSKGLVRYALACEYSRQPIKRQDVGQKVLGTHTRQFKAVFDAANSQLMDIFGMRMEELPLKEKVTSRQKRAAVASESAPKSSNMWALQNILPAEFRQPAIVQPGRDPLEEDDPDAEAAYVGLYTTIITLILLAGGSLPEGKLDRSLRRMNADRNTPIDTTERVLARMIKEQYIVKVKESHGGEDVVDYVVGPRGKVEVGKEGAAHFARTVFGDDTEDLEQRLARSLGLENDEGEGASMTDEAAAAPAVQPVAQRSGRAMRRN